MSDVLFTGTAQFLRRHRSLLAALERAGFTVCTVSLRDRDAVERIRYAAGAARASVAGILAPSRRGLRERLAPRAFKAAFERSPIAFDLASEAFERRIARLSDPPRAVVHIFGLATPLPRRDDLPFAHYLDYTFALAHRAGVTADVGAAEAAGILARERRSYARAATLFPMSDLVRASLVDDYGIAPEKIVLAGAGPNIAPDGVPAPKAFGSRRLLFNASDFTRKGGELVFAAFERMYARDARTRLVTVGGALPRAFRGRPGVEERGSVPAELMRELVLGADLLLAPASNDPFPGVVIEAMAHGTPAIVRARDGMPEIVTDGRDGIVLADAQADPARLADIVATLLADESRLRAFSRAALATIATRLNWDVTAAAMAPFLRSARQRR